MHRVISEIVVFMETPDGDCLARAVAIARHHRARLLVCEVIPPAPKIETARPALVRRERALFSATFSRLRALSAPFMADTDLEYSVLIGQPVLSIVSQVMGRSADLLIHISDTDPVTGGLNSNGMHFVRKCPCPVLSLHPGKSVATRDVIVAVGPDATNKRLALELWTYACSAAPQAERIHLLQAWQPYGQLQGFDAQLFDQSDDTPDAEEAHYRAGLADLCAQLGTTTDKPRLMTHLRQEAMPDAVTALAAETGADLAVVSNLANSTVGGMLIGSNVESLLARTALSVLSIKPHDYRSPLALFAEAAPKTA